ncbi:MAG TPA: hypothetical protein VLC95_07855 [Anaerolineae bacterium]|nr:hypothetical protein [Anaerolineae bacterium]
MEDRRFPRQSFKSAVVMASIVQVATFSIFLTSSIVVRGVPFEHTWQAVAMVCGGVFVVSLVLALPVAFIIYRLDGIYLRPQAALRWLVMGLLLGLFSSLILVFLPDPESAGSAAVATALTVAGWMLGAGALYLSHWLAFKAWALPHEEVGG